MVLRRCCILEKLKYLYEPRILVINKKIYIYNILQALLSPKREGKCGTRGLNWLSPSHLSVTLQCGVLFCLLIWALLCGPCCPPLCSHFHGSFVVSKFSSLWLGISWVSLEENQSIFKNVKEIFSDIQASRIIGS